MQELKPPTVVTTLDGEALSKALHIGNRNEAIKAAVDIYVTPLIGAAARIEDPQTLWFVVIPEELYELGRPLSKVPVAERIQGAVRMTRQEALRLVDQHTLFGIGEAEAEVYKYAAHFRRQLKARLLSDKIVTQIIRETTLAPNDFLKSNGQTKRRVEDPPPSRGNSRPARITGMADALGNWATCAPACAMSGSPISGAR